MEVHVRADEGITRKRSDPLPALDRRRTDNQSKLGHLTEADEAEILKRVARGELMINIARELGVTPQAMSLRFSKREDYLLARESGHEARIDEAEEWVEGASDALELARARDVWRARSWRASVESPNRWGDKKHVTIELTGDLGERLRRSREREVQGESTRIQQDAPQQLAETAVVAEQPIMEHK